MFLGNEGRGITDSDTVKRSASQFDLPLKKDRKGLYKLRDRLVLTSMTSDFFIEEADLWREDAWNIIRQRRDLTFEILTKRPQRIERCLPDDWNGGYPNVRLSVSAEDQRTWDSRVRILTDIPAVKRDVFMAPMIGRIDAGPILSEGKIDCIYLGGEYCGRARPCDFEWVEAVRESCVENGVSLFWRNCGQLLIKDGQMMEFDSIQAQGRFCLAHPMDHVVDDPIPRVRQSRLF